MLLQVVRRDALPEEAVYKDTGCSVSPSCLNCPLEVCVLEMPGHSRGLNAQRLKEQVRVLRFQHGKKISEIMAELRISRRTVFRALEAP